MGIWIYGKKCDSFLPSSDFPTHDFPFCPFRWCSAAMKWVGLERLHEECLLLSSAVVLDKKKTR